MKILYIAYASSPYGGSEEAVGWNLPLAMSQNIDNDVHLITKIEQKEAIEDYSSKHPELRLHVYYCESLRSIRRFTRDISIQDVMVSG